MSPRDADYEAQVAYDKFRLGRRALFDEGAEMCHECGICAGHATGELRPTYQIDELIDVRIQF